MIVLLPAGDGGSGPGGLEEAWSLRHLWVLLPGEPQTNLTCAF